MNLKNLVLSNPHTTGAAGVYFAVKVVAQLASVWSPAWYAAHQQQINTTTDIIEGAAIFYMGAAAGDASKSVSKQEVSDTKQEIANAIKSGDTSFLTKDQTKPV